MTLAADHASLSSAIVELQRATLNLKTKIVGANRQLATAYGGVYDVVSLETINDLAMWTTITSGPTPTNLIMQAIRGGAAGTVRRIAGPVGVAARALEQKRSTMNQRARVVEQGVRGATSAVQSILQATGVCTGDCMEVRRCVADLAAAAKEDRRARTVLEAYRGSLWAQNDPAEVPLIFTTLRLPDGNDRTSWLASLYRTTVGEQYAELHPLTDAEVTDPDEPEGFNWGSLRYIIPIGLGLGGGILVIWGMRKVGL